MPKIPIRDLGAVGIIKDSHPYDLTPNGWSDGRNVRFDNGQVGRGPVFRKVGEPAAGKTPVFSYGIKSDESSDETIIVYSDMSIDAYNNGQLLDQTPTDASFSPFVTSYPTVGVSLGGVHYLNRESHVPIYKGPGSSTFEPLPNWDTDHRCSSLRSFRDFLIALNITKSGITDETLVKWSDLTLAGQAPGSWDHTDPNTSAGENPLTDMTGPIIDGGTLRNVFVIYGRYETYLMEHVGPPFIFSFRRAFSDAGIINHNCYVEVDGKHYVFGNDDIYVHDGVSRQSIADGRIRDHIFSNLDHTKTGKFYAQHDRTRNEILFCYSDSRDEVAFPRVDYCNAAAGYNYVSNTWTFYDLPNTTSGTTANVAVAKTWANVNSTWGLVGASWADMGDDVIRHTLILSVVASEVGLSTNKLLALDGASKGTVFKSRDIESTKQAYVSRTGIDMDEAGFDLETRKANLRVLPQLSVITPDSLAEIRIGFHDMPSGAIRWGRWVSFDPRRQYKIDSRTFGRYLALEVRFPDDGDCFFSGYDIEMRPISRR